MTLVAVASRSHYADHLAPILAHVEHEWRDPVLGDDVIVASYADLRTVRKANPSRIILAQHGAGQSYGGDPRSANLPAYPGGDDNGDVDLFLVPNDHAAARWRARYPAACVEVIGPPILDALPSFTFPRFRSYARDTTVVGIAVHWGSWFVPEARSAWSWHAAGIRQLAERRSVIGSWHPRAPGMPRRYRSMGVEPVSLPELFARADVLIADNTSVLFDFAATGRPVVVLDAPWYRRDVRHGLRFWDCAMIGPTARNGDELPAAVDRALALDAADVLARELAVDIAYPYRSGAGRRGADAIRDLLEP